MSFSTDVKMDITASSYAARHCQIAAIYSFMVNIAAMAYSGDRQALYINTDNRYLALNFCKLVDLAFGIRPFVRIRLNRKSGKRSYLAIIKDGQGLSCLLKATGNFGKAFLGLDPLILKRNCCKRAYLKSVFISNASISNPDKNYHLEFVFTDKPLAEINKQLLEHFSLKPKLIKRKKNHVVYIKDGEKIALFLGLIGAHHSLLDFEGLRVFKTVSNEINRQVNCEAANIAKTAKAYVSCQEDIILIERLKGLSYLSRPLREAADLRLEWPNATLKEIGEKMNPPISKSGVNHRLRKISEIAEKLRGDLYG